MKENTRYLGRQLIWPGTGLLLSALAFGVALATGQSVQAILLIAAIVAVLLIYLLAFRRADRRIRQLLQADSAGPLIAFYQRSKWADSLPHGDAHLAHASALAYALYADYTSARSALSVATWDECPPLIRAARTSVEALLSYFETREYIQGLNLALAAQEMAATPAAFPGVPMAAAAFESYVEIGQVLCGRSTDATVASLARKMSALPTIGRLLVAWGLTVAHRQRGEAGAAEVMLTYLREVAPHCRALALPDNPTQAEQTAAADWPRD